MAERFRVGADIGGTFTDLVVAAPDGRAFTRKVLSTPDDYSRGIVDGLSALLAGEGLDAGSMGELVHATTVATNSILELRGARTALLTTRGFRDVLELRRLRAPQLYNLRFKPPRPLVERRLRFEIAERMAATGEVLEPLDESSVLVALEQLKSAKVEAVAICFLHSYRNPIHERRVGDLVRERLPGVFVSISSEVLPEIREYERTSTTVINAYVGPVVKGYLDSLVARLAAAGIDVRLEVMQSNGGVMAAAAAAEKPAAIVESGPAAGVIAAQALGARLGLPNLISFDMGGTTAKASLIEAGQVSRTSEYEVGAGMSISSRLMKGAGHALKLPVLDIAEVGAGGGSVVWVDQGGALKVGPRSAGAAPGPACYGAGGTEPTVTDANLLLGYLNPVALAGGSLGLSGELAAKAMAPIAAHLGIGLLETAFGVHTLANATMIRALKAVSTYRGRDPRDFVLMAFGGSGPIHAAGMARELGISTVVVPPACGVLSAIGLLEAQPQHHFSLTHLARLEATTAPGLEAAFSPLLARSAPSLGTDGVEVRRQADLRYVGQATELTLPVIGDGATLAAAFHREHERVYGHHAEAEPVEIVSLRLEARIPVERPRLRISSGGAAGGGLRDCHFEPGGVASTPVLVRAELGPAKRPGPLVIEDDDSTTVVPPGCTVRADAEGNLFIEVT